MHIKFKLIGEEYSPSIYGGYLIIYNNNVEVSIVCIPSLTISNDGNLFYSIIKDSCIYDEFGNEYDIDIILSVNKVIWRLVIETTDNSLRDKIKIEYQPTCF
ncbi:hypothetical protein [Proteus penneri]|uniref:Uncharacterized protein n=1 Tax=Proteus penneri TaxID=102862 RepID=A0A0G4PZW3_9GAMM|nr:hypothetical protein [Proteus penneri]CRL59078.1 hypothetical protein BN1804_00251 [Proteus penneri]